MAQVLAVPGEVRHGFSFNCSFNHDFGRITGIAATAKGNVLLCDFDKKNLILVDPLGNYLKNINVDSEPYDVAITGENVGYITQPFTRSVLQIDPDRMIIVLKTSINDLGATVMCSTAFSTSLCFLCFNLEGQSYVYHAVNNAISFPNLSGHWSIGPHIIKCHAVDEGTCFSCHIGHNYITESKMTGHIFMRRQQNISIATIDTPTDICSDDNGHIYVSGQGSNNIHRLTKERKVIDIPLHSQHGITQPVTISFNQTYTKLYIVNEWGKSVLVFDVI
ncbi:Hypothetical predicted protein [Mytilus galloprovincialis]|uniref:Uncharacterized protein n=1 Tax=Mytilus galloprovincialis TaxID=29158 RepID=A0A8B6HBK0_MYTGA|nr:Hypothetical predicted protein [Mytilus galloprovincialis]